jgi:hypothetical protein
LEQPGQGRRDLLAPMRGWLHGGINE